MRHNWIWFLTSALIIASAAGCYPPALVPAGETGVPPAATRAPVQSLPAEGSAAVMTGTPAPGTATPANPATPTGTQEQTMATGVPIPTPLDLGLQKLVTQAREDLAGRLRIEVSEVELVDLQSVVWPDASLGCPQPGMAYIQVPEDGVLIRLRAAGRVYEYHGGGNRSPFLCEQVIRIKETPPKLDKFVPPPGGSGDK